MYLITKIETDGSRNPSFTGGIRDIQRLLLMATPNKCSFEIKKIA